MTRDYKARHFGNKSGNDMQTGLIVIIGLVLAYPIVSGALLRAAGPARLEFADLLKRLLADPTVSESTKERLSEMADDVFDWKFMAFATVAFPYIAFTRRFSVDLGADEMEFMQRKDAQRLTDLHMKCVMAASPFFAATFIVSALFSIVFLILAFGWSSIQKTWADTVKTVSPKATG